MKTTFNGFTPQVSREIEAINEREEIQAIVNAEFKQDEKNAFVTMLSFVCGVFVIVPCVIMYL